MVAIALLCAVTCYAAATVLAATPLARPIGPPVGPVVTLLGIGLGVHLAALIALGHALGTIPLAGLGPALSFAGLALAVALIIAESLARDVTLTFVGAPLAAIATSAAVIAGVGNAPLLPLHGVRELWLLSHIALSFVGIAALATAAAAGALYLVERRELKSRRFGRVFHLFPPLETLDRINHLGVLIAWLALTGGVALASTYVLAYGRADGARVAWGLTAWLVVSALALGRVLGGWRARRAAVAAAIAFAVTVITYLAARAMAARPGEFL